MGFVPLGTTDYMLIIRGLIVMVLNFRFIYLEFVIYGVSVLTSGLFGNFGLIRFIWF